MVSSVSPCTLPCSMAFTWSGDIFLTPRPVSSLHAVTMSDTNMTIHVRETKGRIDRYTILSQKNLDLLTEYWYD